MNNKIKKIGFLIIILMMVLTNTLGSHPSVYAISEEPKIESNIVYDKDKTKADIQLSVVNTEKKVIHEIKNPDGNIMDMGQLTWSTDKNGEYTFKVTYMDTLSNQKNTEDEKIVVDEIGVLKQQTRSFDELQFQLQQQYWAPKADTFVLTPFLVMPSDVQGGIISIHLPQYIKVNADEIRTDANIETVNVTGSSDTSSGMDITLKLKDSINGNIGKDISISQSDFIAKSKVSNYTIEAVYQSKDGKQKTNSVTLTPTINWSEDITYSLTKAIIPNETNLQFQMTTKANLTQFGDDFVGNIVLPSDMVKTLNIDENQGTLQTNGSLEIRIEKSNIADSKTIKKNIRISPVAKEIVKDKIKSVPFSIDIEFDDGRKDTFKNEVSFYYPEIIVAPKADKEIGVLNFLNSIQDNLTYLKSSGNQWEFKMEGVARDSNGNQVAVYGGGSREHMSKFFSEALKNQVISIKLPSELKLINEKNSKYQYDKYTHTLSNINMTGSYSTSGSAGSKHDFFSKFQSTKFGLDYNFDNPQELKKNMGLTDMQFSLEYFENKLTIGDKYLGNISLDTSDIVPVKRVYAGKLNQGDKGKELFSLSWSGAERDAIKDGLLKDGYKMPAINTVMNVAPSKIKIKNVTFNQEVINKTKLAGLNLKMYYTTNQNNDKKEIELTKELLLKSDEYITSIYIDNSSYVYDKSIFGDDAQFITFYGDVEEQSNETVKYYLDIKSTIPNSGLLATPIKQDDAELNLVRATPKSNFFKSFEPSLDKFDADVRSNVIYPGDTGAFTLTMNDEYTLSNVRPETVDIHVKVDELKYLRVTGLTNLYAQTYGYLTKYRSVDIKKITYKTNKNSSTRLYENTNADKYFDFKLGDSEYFTELTITVDTEKQDIYMDKTPLYKEPIYSLSLYISNPHHDTFGNEKDKIGFYLNNNEYYENNSISYNEFDVKHKVEIELTTHNENSIKLNKDLNIGEEIDISTTVKRSDSALGKPLNDTPRNVVVNPTYYFKIPRYLSYVENSFNINSVQKKPKISILSGESLDEYFLKVEFYGDPGSETGWNQSYIDVNFKLKVENYAPRGSIGVSIETYEDISNTLELYNKYIEKNQWMMVRVKTLSFNNDEGMYVDGKAFIFAGDKSIEVVKSKNMPKISGIVLHSLGTMILQNVSGGTNTLPKNNTQIKSGELYNSYIDIINNSGELQDFTMYIPVPRTNRVGDYGSYGWDAKLLENVSHNSSNINIQYSTDVNATKNKWKNGTEDANGMYIDANGITDFSKVTMIKISAAKIDASKNVSIYAKFSDLKSKNSSGEMKSEIYGYYSYKLQGSSNYTTSQSPAVTVTLKDTIISGYLFEDNNSDGLKNNGDTVLANKEVTLYDKNDKAIEVTRSDVNGFYKLTVPSIPEKGYLMVEKIPGYSYTINKNEENPTSIVSSFNPITEKAYPTLSNSEKLNAGFIKTPDIVLKSDSLTVRVNKTGKIAYDLFPPDMSKDIKFESTDNSIATVDDKGIVTGLTVGETNVRVYYETITGIKIYEDVRIIVIANDPSILVRIPKYIELKDDENGDIKALPEVELYSGNKNDDKTNIPKVNIYVDSSVALQKDTDKFTAQTYSKDDQPYTNLSLPILQLEYGKIEKDYFQLKADKKIIPKNIGIYQGLLNFTMEFEGD